MEKEKGPISSILKHRSAQNVLFFQKTDFKSAFLNFPGLKSSLERCQLNVYMHSALCSALPISLGPLFCNIVRGPWGCAYKVILHVTASFWFKLRTWSPRNVVWDWEKWPLLYRVISHTSGHPISASICFCLQFADVRSHTKGLDNDCRSSTSSL